MTADPLRHRDIVDKRCKLCGVRRTDDTHVFSLASDHSAPMCPDYSAHRFGDICRVAGVSGVRLHDLRHFVTTRLLAAGHDVRTIAERLGHERPDVTLRAYSASVRARDDDAAITLGAPVKPGQ